VDVRGDSRRDLYSKTLALCGLGLLAGAGALVDYWPVGVRFPLAASPVFPAAAVTASDTSVEDPMTVLAGLLAAPAQRRAKPTQDIINNTLPEPVLMLASYESFPTMDLGFDIGTRVDVERLPAPAFVSVRYESSMLPGAPVQLTGPAPARVDRAFPQAADTDDSGGFLAAAFRKTGTSIVRTGVKTGTSLVDAVRVVGSVVRRALPN
jgi:hypothetical protein